MDNLNQFPYVRIVLPFALGIVVSLAIDVPATWMTCVFLLVAAIYILSVMHGRIRKYRRRWMYGAVIHVALFMAGYQLVSLRLMELKVDQLPEVKRDLFCVARLLATPEEKANSFRTTARLIACRTDSAWTSMDEKVLLYFGKESTVADLEYGDQVLLRAAPQEVEGPVNPGAFNYQRYLKFNGIIRQLYAPSGQWKKIYSARGNKLIRLSILARNELLEVLQESGLEGKELALASAILLGYDEYLDREHKQQFAGAGAMHILCVSGLHVGIIAVVFNALLFFLSGKGVQGVLKLVLLLLLIWTYAAITGFSPSVLRAATMFSFIYAGRTINRTVSIYNMLAASAFLLLVINPFLLTRVGFQLSYLAVTGIVLLYRPLSNLVMPRYALAEKIWQLSVVSLTATFATFPLGLYYFNQFPNLFLLTNLVAIPASFLILYNGMLLLAFSFSTAISSFLGYIFRIVLTALNLAVEWIEGLSFSTTTGVYLTTAQVLLLISICVSVVVLLYGKGRRYLHAALVMAVLLAFSVGHRNYKSRHQWLMVGYAIRGHMAMEFVNGRCSVFICDSGLYSQPQKIDFATSGFRLQHGVKHTLFTSWDADEVRTSWFLKKSGFICFRGRLLFKIDDRSRSLPDLQPLELSWVVPGRKVRPEIMEGISAMEGSIVLPHASMPPWEKAAWKQACREAGIEYYDPAENGAYICSGVN